MGYARTCSGNHFLHEGCQACSVREEQTSAVTAQHLTAGLQLKALLGQLDFP